MRIFVNHFDDEIGAKPRIGFAFRSRQLNIRQPVLSMPKLRSDQLLIQRMLCSASDEYIAASRQRNDLERILQSLSPIHVARHHGKSFHFELRRIQSENDGHGVVGTGVGIDNYTPRRSLGGGSSRQEKNEERNQGKYLAKFSHRK